MKIEITIPRPWLALGSAAATLILLALHAVPATPVVGAATGGTRQNPVQLVQAQQDFDRASIERAVLDHREQIIRYQLEQLEDEARQFPSAANDQQRAEDRAVYMQIIGDRIRSEQLLSLSLQQLLEEGTGFSDEHPNLGVSFEWPVEPDEGISAPFHSAFHIQKFGVEHYADDIPAPQGTTIHAPLGGIVAKVADNGLGFSYLVLDHGNGIKTRYGHVSRFLVAEGERVMLGQPIAKTGGRWGAKGSGLMTTGPHLHFELWWQGKRIDPLPYLPPRATVKVPPAA